MPKYYDNTTLKAYRECPRYYYLRHRRHFRRSGTGLALVFGLAWHDAMDVVWTHAADVMSDTDLTLLAQAAFETRWMEEGQALVQEASFDEIAVQGKRNTSTAMSMLAAYIKKRRTLLSQIDLVACEQPFAVPVTDAADSNDIWYVGRLDKVFRYNGDGIIGEHKTSSMYKKDGGFRQTFIDGFNPNAQIEGYLFAANIMFNFPVRQCWVDASLVHDTHREFSFIPISYALANLPAWRDEMVEWVNRVELDNIKGIYPRRTEACVGVYGRCQFYDICSSVNDLDQLHDMKQIEGYVIDEWKPFDILELAKLNLKDDSMPDLSNKVMIRAAVKADALDLYIMLKVYERIVGVDKAVASAVETHMAGDADALSMFLKTTEAHNAER